MATQLGRYQLQRPIGRGGMAEVWLASRRGAGGVEKRVVVKRILRERVKDPRFLDLFVREAEISMSLSHKNIVPIFDFGRVGDELFLVMDYVDGPNLALALSVAHQRGRMPNAILSSHIIFEACQALAYAHDYKDDAGAAQRIAHRDVTPGNLLLSFSGEVKLGDFGLAAATADLREGDGGTRGTPGYMAPEQAHGELVGPAADLFSLGLIFRETLIGARLRKGDQAEQLRAARQALPALPDTVPPPLADICQRACMFEPAERYPSAQAMAADLDVYLVRARAETTSDRRPMPQQLSDWLAEIFPKGLVTKSYTGTQVEGSARTFLDHGLQDLLEEHGEATLRSMAATAVDPGAAVDESSPRPQSETSKAGTEVPPRSFRRSALPWLGALAFLGTGGGLFLTFKGDSAPAEETDAGTSHVVVRADADARADAGPDAGARADAGPRDASLADAARSQAQVPRSARHDAATEALATLRVSSTPWATVRVQGRSESCDETPCRIALPKGRYQLLLENPIAGLKKSVSVVVDGDTAVHQVLEPAR